MFQTGRNLSARTENHQSHPHMQHSVREMILFGHSLFLFRLDPASLQSRTEECEVLSLQHTIYLEKRDDFTFMTFFFLKKRSVLPSYQHSPSSKSWIFYFKIDLFKYSPRVCPALEPTEPLNHFWTAFFYSCMSVFFLYTYISVLLFRCFQAIVLFLQTIASLRVKATSRVPYRSSSCWCAGLGLEKDRRVEACMPCANIRCVLSSMSFWLQLNYACCHP